MRRGFVRQFSPQLCKIFRNITSNCGRPTPLATLFRDVHGSPVFRVCVFVFSRWAVQPHVREGRLYTSAAPHKGGSMF